MSYITDVVVHADYLTKETKFQLTGEFYAGTYNSGEARLEYLYELGTSDAGGGKVFTGSILAGSYNHLDREAFLKWLDALPWSKYDHAVISIASEGEYYTIHYVLDGELKLAVEWYG